MPATELMHHVRSLPPEQQAITMAVAVLFDRLQKLSVEEQADLLALVKEFTGAATDEERANITDTMLEIFEARPSTIASLDGAPESRPDATQKWCEFVAKKVRQAREQAQMTQERLAEASGLPQSHISRIETAKLSPSRLTLEKIAKALGRSVADFDHCAERSDGK